MGYGDYVGNRPDTKRGMDAVEPLSISRLNKTLVKIMITTDIHANRLYITSNWYVDIPAIHVEYLLYHLSLNEIASFEHEIMQLFTIIINNSI